MRVIGALMFLAGGAGTAFSVWAVYHRSRPHDLLFAAGALVAFAAALLGLVLVFVPTFV